MAVRRLIYSADHSPARQLASWTAMAGGFGLVALMVAFGADAGHWGPELLGLALPGVLVGFGGLVSVLQRTTLRIDQDLVRAMKWPFGAEQEMTRKSAGVHVDLQTSYDAETRTTTKHYTLFLSGSDRAGQPVRLKLATGFGVPKLADELRASLAAVPPRIAPGGPPSMLETSSTGGIASDAVLSVRVDPHAESPPPSAEEADAVDAAIARAEAEERDGPTKPQPPRVKSWKK